ncbi:MAG: hypothetical protein IT318_23330 [Anaerolineales bacterium]|nr:hypothetical protein [Anaerolineales bacterium]
MSPNFIDDIDIVDQTTIEATGPLYPVAQWLHGDPKLAAAGGVAHTGGVILPAKYLDDSIAPAPGWSRTTVGFSSGKSEAVLAAHKPRLAVIRTRFRWFVVYNGVTTYYPRPGYVADSGMRGHVQALCGVHGFDFPIVVTFKGKASQEFERLLREFSQKAQEAAYRLAREKERAAAARVAPNSQNRFPRFAFYMRLVPGPHVKVGQKGQESIITPPVLEMPSVVSEEYLSKVYVGRDRLQEFQQAYHEATEWGAAWDRPGAEETLDDHDVEPAAAELG